MKPPYSTKNPKTTQNDFYLLIQATHVFHPSSTSLFPVPPPGGLTDPAYAREACEMPLNLLSTQKPGLPFHKPVHT